MMLHDYITAGYDCLGLYDQRS